MKYLIILTACVFATTQGQVSDEWITQITDTDFGNSVSFYCNTSLQSNQPPNGSLPEKWMFNDLTNAPSGYNGTKREISNDGYTMTILNVSTSDFGIYHCMMMTEEMEWYLIKLGLNVRGPYYEDLWEKYRMNTIIGLSACLGFMLIAIVIIVIYKNRYILDEESVVIANGKEYGTAPIYANDGYIIENAVEMSSSSNGQYYEPPVDYENTPI